MTADIDIDAVLKADGTALTELIAFRRAELRGNDVGSNEWLRYADRLRDAADRLIASTDRLAGVLHAVRDEVAAPVVHPSSSVAGLAALRRGAALAGLTYARGGRVTRPEVYDLPCGHRPEEACEACVPDMPSLVAMAARHYPEQCVSNASCTCACDTCMAEHNPEGA
jgi:hypothetical protein